MPQSHGGLWEVLALLVHIENRYDQRHRNVPVIPASRRRKADTSTSCLLILQALHREPHYLREAFTASNVELEPMQFPQLLAEVPRATRNQTP